MGFKKSLNIEKSTEELEKPNNFGVRHVQALLMFFGLVFGYFLRVNMSAAIVPMTQATAGAPFYDWDTAQKSLVLSSFFWGYVIVQVPSGLLAKRYGAKPILGIATIIASILTMIQPVAVSGGSWQMLCFLRVLIGLTQGVVYPTVHTLLAKWAPCTERSFLATTVYSGAQLGSAIILATSGVIFNSSMGWPGIFYISGGIALLWSIVFLIYGAEKPENSTVISESERNYIIKLTGSHSESATMSIPWKSILTSPPFYGLIAAHCGFVWGFYTLLTEIPSYMNSVLKLDVHANALLSALPYFVMWILCFVVSPFSDMIINHDILSVGASRKLFSSIGQIVPMGCLIALGYMTENEKMEAIVLLTISVGFNAFQFCGYLVNHMDLSPNFAGPMMSVSNLTANFLSIFTPLVVGAFVKNEEDPYQWRVVFFITAGFYLLCNSLFIVFGSGVVQPWNDKSIIDSPTTTLPSIQNENSKENDDL